MKEINFEEALEIALTQRQINLISGKKPSKVTRKEVEAGFLEAFELVGGISRLAMWANNPANYGDFLKLYAKLIPKEASEEAGQVFIYESSVPASALNKPKEISQIKDVVGSDDGPATK